MKMLLKSELSIKIITVISFVRNYFGGKLWFGESWYLWKLMHIYTFIFIEVIQVAPQEPNKAL